MGDGIGVLSGLHERQQVIRHPATRLRAVAAQLLVEQADVLRPRHLDNRAFPDRAARMENPTGSPVNVDKLADEILDADVTVIPLGHRKRSEVRSDGKECVSRCRSRWSPDHKTKKKKTKQ